MMHRRTALLALFVACLALSGCTAEEEQTFFMHVILFCFGVGAGCASMGGSAVALVRAAQRKGRSFVNFALAIPFVVVTLMLHALVTNGFTRALHGFDRDSLWLFAMTSAPLFWLTATIIEVVIAPPPPAPRGSVSAGSPVGGPGADPPPPPPPVDPVKVVSAAFLPLLVIVGYGALIVHTLPPSKPSSTPSTSPVSIPVPR